MVKDSIIYHSIIYCLLIFLKAMKSPTTGFGALQGVRGQLQSSLLAASLCTIVEIHSDSVFVMALWLVHLVKGTF